MADSAHQIAKRIFRVTLLKGAGLAATLVVTLLQAAAFGAGPAADAFHLIRQTMASLTSAIEGGIQKLLVPWYLREGSGRAGRSPLIPMAFLVSLMLAAAIALAAPWVVRLIAPGFDADRAQIAVLVLRVLAFALPCYVMTAILASAAHAGRRFSVAAFAALLPRLAALLGFLMLGLTLSVVDMALWFLGGMIAMLVVLAVVSWRRATSPLAMSPGSGPKLITGPRLAAIVVFFATQVVLTWANGFLASLGATGTAALFFLTLRLLNAAPGLANTAVSTVYYTEYASDALQGQAGRTATLIGSLSASAFFVFPVMAVLVALAEPLVRLIFLRGAFGAEDAELMALALRILAPTLLINGVVAMLYTSAMADPATRLLRLTLRTGAVSLILRLAFGLVLVDSFGLLGLAVAVVASGLGQMALLLADTWALHGAAFCRDLWARLSRIALASLAAGVAGFASQGLGLGPALAVFTVTFLATAGVLNVPETRALRQMARV